MNTGFLGPAVATVLTVYGIETKSLHILTSTDFVATVLTVYGIETTIADITATWSTLLQQYLPFTVLKPCFTVTKSIILHPLQQYLPFTVLKH